MFPVRVLIIVCIILYLCVFHYMCVFLLFSFSQDVCLHVRLQLAHRSLSRGKLGVGAVRVGLVVFAKIVVSVDVYDYRRWRYRCRNNGRWYDS